MSELDALNFQDDAAVGSTNRHCLGRDRVRGELVRAARCRERERAGGGRGAVDDMALRSGNGEGNGPPTGGRERPLHGTASRERVRGTSGNSPGARQRNGEWPGNRHQDENRDDDDQEYQDNGHVPGRVALAGRRLYDYRRRGSGLHNDRHLLGRWGRGRHGSGCTRSTVYEVALFDRIRACVIARGADAPSRPSAQFRRATCGTSGGARSTGEPVFVVPHFVPSKHLVIDTVRRNMQGADQECDDLPDHAGGPASCASVHLEARQRRAPAPWSRGRPVRPTASSTPRNA